MPKTFIAQSITSVGPLHLVAQGGVLTAVLVTCEVNYGELGMTQQVDILPDLDPGEVNDFLEVYKLIRKKVEAIILG